MYCYYYFLFIVLSITQFIQIAIQSMIPSKEYISTSTDYKLIWFSKVYFAKLFIAFHTYILLLQFVYIAFVSLRIMQDSTQ